jgi:hypothetical protein
VWVSHGWNTDETQIAIAGDAAATGRGDVSLLAETKDSRVAVNLEVF